MANIHQNHTSHLTLRETAEVYTNTVVKFFSRLIVIVDTWQARSKARHELNNMDVRMLNDIGLSYDEAVQESRKPFWRQ